MQGKLVQMAGRGRGILSVILFILIGCAQIQAQEITTHPVVRLDLNTGGFLNALPFDRSFLIEGRASSDVIRIRMTFEEYFDAGWVFAQQPARVAALRAEAKALLDSVLVDSGVAAGGGFYALERSLLHLLKQQAGSAGRFSIADVMNVLPWNWGHWAMAMQPQSVRMLAAGSLFDPMDDDSPSKARFRALAEAVVRSRSDMERNIAMERLIGFVIDEARDVRMASVPQPRHPAIQVKWQSLYDRPSPHEESLPTDPSARWNRLEERLQGGTATDTQNFRMVMPPLEANRVYRIRVQGERRSLADSEQPASLNTDFCPAPVPDPAVAPKPRRPGR